MVQKNKEQPKAEEKKPEAVKASESTYTVAELASAAKRWGTMPEVVVAALKSAGKKTATLKETEDIVKRFLSMKIR